MNIQLVIPMAGSSEMFAAAGYVGPKWLIDIDGKPMIQHVVEQFPGVTDILFICNTEELQDPNVENVLKSLGGKVVGIDPNSRGPVDTILQAAEHISDDKEIIVSYCDHGMVWNFDSFLQEVREGDFEGAMTCYNNFHPHTLEAAGLYSFCFQKNNKLSEVQDKIPFTKERSSEFVSSDVFYFKSSGILKKYFQIAMTKPDMNCGGNYFIALVYNLLVADNLSVHVHKIDRMLLWATPEDLGIYKQWSRYFTHKKEDRAPEQDFTLILPMSGKGTRFAQEGYRLPKPLLPVDGKPMVVQVADCLPKHRKDVFVCLDEHSIDRALHDYFPHSIVRVISDVTDGYAASCELGIDLIDEDSPIMISPCDNGVSYDEQAFLDMIADEDNDVIAWSFRNSQASKINPAMYTWMYVDENNFLCDMLYKQVPKGDPLRTHVSVGIMYFRKAKYLLEGLKKNREQNNKPMGELCIDSVAHQLADNNYKVKVFEVDHYACWGTPGDYETYLYWENHFSCLTS
jgi:NDP-sugar pyrophosphorylase family protein